MSHDRNRLENTIAQLQAELQSQSDLDPAFRQRLESTLEELRAALAQQEYSESSTNEETPLVQRLAESARHFEETHPNLSGMIGSIIDALGRMGI